MRIATLLPSATEIACALGMDGCLVGVSHSCGHTPGVASLPRMTSTRVPVDADSRTIDSFVRGYLNDNEALYDLDLAALREAAPDVVISQTLCDVCAVSTGDVFRAIEELPSRPVLVDLAPKTLDDVLSDCKRVGDALGVPQAADALLADLQARLDAVAARTGLIPGGRRLRVGFLEWLHPPFNGGHWNPELVTRAGGIDVFGAHGKPSTTLTWEQLAAGDPDVLFVACCGFDAGRGFADVRALEECAEWRSLRAVRNVRVLVANGRDYFSCPGPRLVDSLEIMAHALYPDVHPDLHPASRPAPLSKDRPTSECASSSG